MGQGEQRFQFSCKIAKGVFRSLHPGINASVFVNRLRFSFTASTREEIPISAVKSIKTNQRKPALLRIVLQDGNLDISIADVTSRPGLATEVKQLINDTLALVGDGELCAQVLSANKGIRSDFDLLCRGKVVEPADFWAQRIEWLRRARIHRAQTSGVGEEEARTRQAILTSCPVVLFAKLALVPQVMSDAEFWTKIRAAIEAKRQAVAFRGHSKAEAESTRFSIHDVQQLHPSLAAFTSEDELQRAVARRTGADGAVGAPRGDADRVGVANREERTIGDGSLPTEARVRDEARRRLAQHRDRVRSWAAMNTEGAVTAVMQGERLVHPENAAAAAGAVAGGEIEAEMEAAMAAEDEGDVVPLRKAHRLAAAVGEIGAPRDGRRGRAHPGSSALDRLGKRGAGPPRADARTQRLLEQLTVQGRASVSETRHGGAAQSAAEKAQDRQVVANAKLILADIAQGWDSLLRARSQPDALAEAEAIYHRQAYLKDNLVQLGKEDIVTRSPARRGSIEALVRQVDSFLNAYTKAARRA